MKEVYVTDNEVDLQMIIGVLDSQGISTQVQTDGAGDYFRVAGSDFNISKRVLVKDEDWQKALDVIENNGFRKTKKSSGNNRVAVWTARIIVIILLVALFITLFGDIFNNL